MPGTRLIEAAGAAVFRDDGKVLLVHRPAYDDWALPKGKMDHDEWTAQTAVREVAEEGSVTVRLRSPLRTVGYMTDRGAKRVHFWVASVVEAKRFRPNSEIDKIRWAAPDRALRLLSYADERHVLEEARTTPRTVPIVIARHGKAMLRRNWTGKDPLRPLASRGRKQADDLTGLLGAFGVVTVASSSSTRCVQTMRPYARQLRTEVETWSILSEEHGESNPKDVRTLVQRLARTAVQEDRPLVVSGHRPVLPTMFEALGVDPRPLTPGAAAVVHLDAEGETRATEWYRPLR